MMASTSSSPTHVSNFRANDLIWAKMKGYPPWPAKVLNSNSDPSTSYFSAARISVLFYGTRETALMKPSDLFPYMKNRHQFEVPRKDKGFNEGVNEIRQSAGLPIDPLFAGDSEVIAPPRFLPESYHSHPFTSTHHHPHRPQLDHTPKKVVRVQSSMDEPSPARIMRKTVRISPPPLPIRWSCVDKKCRKWYGWVKTNDEIPKDGISIQFPRVTRIRDDKDYKTATSLDELKKLYERFKQKSDVKDEDDAEEETPLYARKDEEKKKEKEEEKKEKREETMETKKRKKAMPKHQGFKIRLGTTKKEIREMEAARPKRKYTKRKDREAAAAAEGGVSQLIGPDAKNLPNVSSVLSPLTQREASFCPSALQRRSRWWTAEKRRNDYSPPRKLVGETPMDAAASFRIISQAMRACSVTASNSTGEQGNVAGATDILMDSLCSSMAPLVTLLNQFPQFAPTEDVSTSLWNSCLVHTPIFQ